jgi:ribonuclease HI
MVMNDLKQVTMWTDGACVGNPGPGGYAAVLRCGTALREVHGGVRRTTNNRMELLAVIAGLRALKYRCAVTVHSDARYVVDGVMTGSAHRWQAKGWMHGGRLVPNADLWQQLLEQCARHEVTLCWIKGHAGDPDNERCDLLSEHAARGANLPADEGYESRDKLSLTGTAGQRSLFEQS